MTIYSPTKALFAFACVAAFTFTSCSDTSSPEGTCSAFNNAFADGDLETAGQYCTDDTKALLGSVMGMMTMMDNEAKDEALSEFSKTSPSDFDCEIDGTKAHCENAQTEQSMDLILEDGKWLLDIPKEDLDKE